MNYTTSEAKAIFNRDEQTIRNWAKEFAEFLSPMANPQKGRSRTFTEDDMRVFDLVAKLKDEGKQYVDIHTSLKSGQRGDLPVVSPDELRALTVGQIERRLSLEIQHLKGDLAEAREQLKELVDVKAHNARLEERIELREEQVKTLTTQFNKANEELRQLERQVGRSYHEGYLDALKSKGDSE